jgi:hypothetical protein
MFRTFDGRSSMSVTDVKARRFEAYRPSQLVEPSDMGRVSPLRLGRKMLFFAHSTFHDPYGVVPLMA